jgi:transposase-like protein
MSILSESHFHNEIAAIARLEAIVWPTGAFCPRCGGFDRITQVRGGRAGLRRCGPCKREFTVTVGTVFESSHIKLHLWFQAAHLLTSSKKGISAHQIHRTLKLTYKTAWFMCHRLREAMRNGSLAPMGGPGTIVEIDETFIGNKADMPKRRGFAHKHAVLSLVERGGKVRSFHVGGTSAAHLVPILRANIAKETAIMTDEAGQYAHLSKEFTSHEYVNHGAGEYGRGDVHTNTLEGL